MNVGSKPVLNITAWAARGSIINKTKKKMKRYEIRVR